ncbi:MAG TPA: serine protease [Candidatus Saccharimonadales bacterium]|nr:serine protease [Candidatus Saccharimonadales bacterium]
MSSDIANFWIHTTVKIINENNKTGTGFLISKPDLSTPGKGRVFLVTNKHVIAKTLKERTEVCKINALFNFIDNNHSSIYTESIEISLKNGSDWREHEDPDTDVLAIDITLICIKNQHRLFTKQIPYDLIGDSEKLLENKISIAEEIFVIGYPLGLTHKNTSIPLVRKGISSTIIGEQLEDKTKEDNKLRTRTLKAFLIDGAIIPGSSGSPVVLQPIGFRMGANNQMQLRMGNNMLLGIVAKSRYIPMNSETEKYERYSGLGLAFDGNTIKEVIDLFGQ